MVKGIVFWLAALAAVPSAGQDWVSVATPTVRPQMATTDTIFVATGREMNLWDTQLNTVPNLNAPWFYNFDSTVGRIRDRNFRWRPTVDDTASVTIEARDFRGAIIESASTTVVSVRKNAGGHILAKKNTLFLGDSMIDGGVIVAQVDSLFSVGGGGAIMPVGTLADAVGAVDYYNEGRGGWTWERWATGYAGNPIWDTDHIDFQNYVTAELSAAIDIDYLVIHLGGNDAFTAGKYMDAADIESDVLTYARALVDTMASATYGFPACRTLITLLPTCNANMSGWGDDYAADGGLYEYVANIRGINSALIDEFGGGAYSPLVDVCYAGLWVDNKYGYPSESDSNSARVTDTITVGTNFVHPDNDGRYQMADAIYSHLKHFMDLTAPAATNELVNSYSFSSAATWGNMASYYTITGGQADPWGGTNASLFVSTSTTEYVYMTPALVACNDNDLVFSIVIKNVNRATNENSAIRIHNNDTSTWGQVTVTWAATPTVAKSASGMIVDDFGIEDLGSGWYRVWGYVDIEADGYVADSFYLRISPCEVGPDVGDSVYIAGAQLEFGRNAPHGGYVRTP